ncbi:MAG: TolB family protein [Blastocatellia bacterium]
MDGTIYFSAVRPNGKGSLDIYRSRPACGKYGEPENLGEAVNSETLDTQPYIAPDQSYLIFASTGRADSPIGAGSPYPRSDLYVSFNRDGKWTPARRLPSPINTEATESYPFVSPDGRYLFFTSERNFVSIPMRRKARLSRASDEVAQAGKWAWRFLPDGYGRSGHRTGRGHPMKSSFVRLILFGSGAILAGVCLPWWAHGNTNRPIPPPYEVTGPLTEARTDPYFWQKKCS